MQLNILKHLPKVLGQKHLVNNVMFRRLLPILVFIIFTSCNTVTGTVEGTAIGVAKDIKTTIHYSTCIFTETQCGDLDLD